MLSDECVLELVNERRRLVMLRFAIVNRLAAIEILLPRNENEIVLLSDWQRWTPEIGTGVR